ncbi:MAG: U32 family peptidase [Betaproteobacteria bacterium]|nr:U32 family peptidase [Betaproteobacteria bacterium]MBI2961387.1 U32 family peptidase [Betaproteobacteria bacterium]
MTDSRQGGNPRIALGPVLYYWKRETLLAFYAGLPHSSLAAIYLGEVVCGRRHELRLADWVALARELAQTGVEVVLSSQALIESESDLRVMRRLAGNGEFAVEANEMGAVRLLAGKARFVAGPHLNVYNPDTLAWLAELGAFRWVMPLEIGRDALALLQGSRPAEMQTEVFAYGRLPLAFSARCFTARHFNLPKDDCQYRCIDAPDGLPLATREGKPFLALNGIQTQSAQIYDLSAALPELSALGVDLIRLSPHSSGMNDVIAAFRQGCAGDAGGLRARLDAVRPAAPVDGYWHGKAGIDHVAA